MAQLWLTYEELVLEGLAYNAATARLFAIHHGWTRKKSRDGLSRVLLPDAVAEKTICNMAGRLLIDEKTISVAAYTQINKNLDTRSDDRNNIMFTSLSAA